MNIFSQLKLVIKGLLARKGRSFLTILGIMIGTAGVIIIIALGAGAQSLILSQISKFGTNLIGVMPGKSNENGPPAAVFGVQIKTLIEEDAEAIAKLDPAIIAASSLVRGAVTVVHDGESMDTQFTATTANYTKVQTLDLESGRFFTEEEERGGAQVVVLGYDVNEFFFNDNSAIGKVVKVKNVPMKVIGIAKKQGTVAFQNQDDQIYIPLTIGQKQLLGINYLQAIRLKVDKSENVKFVLNEVQNLLRDRHGIKNEEDEDFSVRDLADAIKLLGAITDALRAFLTLMAALALVVGGIGIMNIMLVTVAERTREIGLRKALGAKNSNIRFQFLLESATVTLIGGICGVIVGVIISFIIAVFAQKMGYDWRFYISPLSIIIAVGVSIATGLLFGIYPATKAAKLDPIEALRYE